MGIWGLHVPASGLASGLTFVLKKRRSPGCFMTSGACTLRNQSSPSSGRTPNGT